jgi:glycosyltransferase involved in cell wall biosynthesis
MISSGNLSPYVCPAPKSLTYMNQTAKRPLLSLCMIVKNEAEYLETCLRLARPHVDEIVIIDTGSTDGTQEIARRYADVFEEIEWPNSFAAARNYSLERASGEYILILDGDEYIADPRSWALLRQLLIEQRPVAVRLFVRNVLPASEIIAADLLWQERVFLNDPSIRYEGKVHNQIVKSIIQYLNNFGGNVINANIEITHFGYAHNRKKIEKKYGSRLKLLKEEFDEAKNPVDKAYFGFQLGVLYYILEKYEDTVRILENIDYDVLHKANPHNAFYAFLIASQAYLKMKEAHKALLCCNNMFLITREEPIVYFITGIALLMKKEIENGLLMLIESFKMNNIIREKRFPLNMQALKESLVQIFEKVGLYDMANQLKEKPVVSPEQVKEVENWLEKIKTGLILKEWRQGLGIKQATP